MLEVQFTCRLGLCRPGVFKPDCLRQKALCGGKDWQWLKQTNYSNYTTTSTKRVPPCDFLTQYAGGRARASALQVKARQRAQSLTSYVVCLSSPIHQLGWVRRLQAVEGVTGSPEIRLRPHECPVPPRNGRRTEELVRLGGSSGVHPWLPNHPRGGIANCREREPCRLQGCCGATTIVAY